MTRAPFVFGKADEAFPRTPPKVFDTTLGLALREPEDGRALSAAVDGRDGRRGRRQVEDRPRGAGRVRPRFAEEGRRRDRGRRVRPRDRAGADPAEGEGGRAGRSSRRTSRRGATSRWKGSPSCRPCFERAGTVTAGNSSPLNDGASGVLVASEDVVRAHGLEPLARVVAHATAGVHPNTMGEGPIPAGTKALARSRLEGEGPRSRRAQRGVRCAGDRVHPRPRARPRAGQRQRRGHRPGPPHRLERRAHARHAALGDEGARSQARHGRALHRGRAGDRDGSSSAEGAIAPAMPDGRPPAEHPYASFVHLVQKPARYLGGEFGARAQGLGRASRPASAWRSPTSTTSG